MKTSHHHEKQAILHEEYGSKRVLHVCGEYFGDSIVQLKGKKDENVSN